jgi:hypothetical protein
MADEEEKAFLKLTLDKLIKENEELIERLRSLYSKDDDKE